MAVTKEAQNILDIALSPMDFIPQMPSDRLRSLYMELEELMEGKVDRELLINYLSGNFAANTHLCVTILRGKNNDDIVKLTSEVRVMIKDELDKRKASGVL